MKRDQHAAEDQPQRRRRVPARPSAQQRAARPRRPRAPATVILVSGRSGVADVLHRRDRRDPGRAQRRQQRGDHGDQHADDERADHRGRRHAERRPAPGRRANVAEQVRQQRADADAGGRARAPRRAGRSTTASSSTEPITWPRLAPIARISASSRVRCATMIENVLRIRKIADEQRHAGEAEQDVVEEAAAPPGAPAALLLGELLAGLAPRSRRRARPRSRSRSARRRDAVGGLDVDRAVDARSRRASAAARPAR